MPRRPASFTESDIRRACKAAPDRTVEIRLTDGTIIRVLPGEKLEDEKTKGGVRI